MQLHISKTINHFGSDNRYVITSQSLNDALIQAESLMPFQITDSFKHQLSNDGFLKENEYYFEVFNNL
jgi:hypothetical protein